MGYVSSRETRPSCEVSERSEEAHRPRDLSYDALREMANRSGRVGDPLDHVVAHNMTLSNEYLELAQLSSSKGLSGEETFVKMAVDRLQFANAATELKRKTKADRSNKWFALNEAWERNWYGKDTSPHDARCSDHSVFHEDFTRLPSQDSTSNGASPASSEEPKPESQRKKKVTFAPEETWTVKEIPKRDQIAEEERKAKQRALEL